MTEMQPAGKMQFEGFFRKCPECEKVTECSVEVDYEKKKSKVMFLRSKQIKEIKAVCNGCLNSSEMTIEEIRKKALPITLIKILTGSR